MNRYHIVRRANKELPCIAVTVRLVLNAANGAFKVKGAPVIGILPVLEIKPDILCRVVVALAFGMGVHALLFHLYSLRDIAVYQKLPYLLVCRDRFWIDTVSSAVAVPNSLLVHLESIVNRVAVYHRSYITVSYGIGMVPALTVPLVSFFLTCRCGVTEPNLF